MKARLYWSYVTRSLRRGGQRTLLAIFCIAVGVMAIVALQLAGLMVGNDLTGNVRLSNGGDVSIRSDVVPFAPTDASYFAGLKSRGLVTAVTGVTDDRAVVSHGGKIYPITLGVVDPTSYPLVGQPTFTKPANGNLHHLLSATDAAVLSTNASSYLHVGIGDRVRLNGSGGHTLTVRIAGLISAGGFSNGGVDAFVARRDYAQTANTPLGYNVFYMTTSGDAQATSVANELKRRYPLATVSTVADALKSRQAQTTQIHQLLQIVGILALLIGGFGVVNTMNVMLARRRIEIAMLKTTGYRRRDLYALFGLEAALLGLLGGILGAIVGVGLSWVVKTLLENAFQLQLPFIVDAPSVIMGIVVGLVTAVIFGLQPIVRAAATRPQAVLRDANEPVERASRLQSVALFLLLSVLFCILASFILGSAIWGIAVVYGTFVLLGLLSLLFSLLVLLISKLPVPERLGTLQVIISAAGLIVALAITTVLPSVGVLLVLVALLGFAVAFLPRPWKATIKMALRNIGRQRARATMTLLALFVGVFCVGLMVILGQDIRDKLDSAIASESDYNVASVVPAQWAGQLDAQLGHLPGLKTYKVVEAAETVPIAVNGRPIAQLIKAGATGRRRGGAGDLGTEGTLAFLSGLGGYNLGHESTDATINPGDGRDLRASDAGSTNVLLNSFLHTLRPLLLKLGDRITLANQDRTKTIVVTVVGFYSTGFVNTTHFEPVLASRNLVRSFGGSGVMSIYTLKVDPKRVDAAVSQLNKSASHALTISLASLGSIVDQILGNLITLLVALAALALFAGIIIIANAVGLAMLERRREQGILKSVGYTSGRVLSGVLIENGIIGGLGGVLGMVLVAVATTVLANLLFKTSLNIPTPTALGLILLVTAIALLTSTLVSWAAVRVRPIEVLRYE